MALENKLEGNYIFGLDIGTRSIVGIVGHTDNLGFHVIASVSKEHETRSMIDGQIHDIERVSQTIKEVKDDLEKKLGFSLHKVCIAAAGRVLRTTTIHVEQAVDTNIPISEEAILALELLGMEKAHQEINAALDENEVGFHCVGYTVTNYYLNDYEINKLLGHKGKKMGADVLATFLPDEVVNSLYKVVENVGLEVYSLTLEPIAAINIAIPQQYRLLNIALVDIGAGTSDIAITKNGSIVAYGMIPTAGDEITEKIVHEYLVDFQTAEKIKIRTSGKRKEISFKDIMGITKKVKTEEILEKIASSIDSLADLISHKIKELNGNGSTNAVFVVGGGGQVKGFTEILASKLDLQQERVALRGKEVLSSISFKTDTKKTPELVTPIGICMTGLLDNKHDFIQVFFNDIPVSIFKTSQLSVMDVAAFQGFDPNKLLARKGKDLHFTIDGLEKVIKGGYGEPALIHINNNVASLNDPVDRNDYISIVPAKKGADGQYTTHELLHQIEPLTVTINQETYTVKRLINCNGKPVKINYTIHENDALTTCGPSISQLLNDLDIVYNQEILKVNGEERPITYCIVDHDRITLHQSASEKNTSDVAYKEDKESTNTTTNGTSILVVVNEKNVTMHGKKEYMLVDVFDYIDFDRTQAKGVIICEINGHKAAYFDSISANDQIKIYWR